MANGIDELVIDTVCIDESNCASLAGTFGIISAFKPGAMSSQVSNPRAPSPTVAS